MDEKEIRSLKARNNKQSFPTDRTNMNALDELYDDFGNDVPSTIEKKSDNGIGHTEEDENYIMNEFGFQLPSKKKTGK